MQDFDPKEKFQTSSEVLQRLFEDGKSPLSQSFLRWKLWNSWKEFVGPSIAQLSEPVGLQNGMLWVWVKNASWMQQLFFMRKELLETLQKKLGNKAIRAIRFTLDRREVPKDEEDQQDMKDVINRLSSKQK